MKKRIITLFLTVILVGLAFTAWGTTPTPTPTIAPSPSPTLWPDCIYGAQGYVTDLTGKSIAGVTIRAGTESSVTDVNGFYQVITAQTNCSAAIYVEASAIGYVTQRKYTGSTPNIYSIDFTLTTDPTATIIIPGDVTSDKKVTIVDAMWTARYVAGLGLTGFEPRAADVNNSGTITINDALLIAQYTAGLFGNLISVQLTSGLPGDQITITGISFDPTNNEIRFIDNKHSILYYSSVMVNSTDGLQITFRIPTYVHPYCYYDPMPCAAPDSLVMGGQYQITVTNSKGVSYALPFIVNPI